MEITTLLLLFIYGQVYAKQSSDLHSRLKDAETKIEDLMDIVRQQNRNYDALAEEFNDLSEKYYSLAAKHSVSGVTAYAAEQRDYSVDQIILFDGVKENYGNNYDALTSVYTCPLNGLYLFLVTLDHRSNHNQMTADIVVDDVRMSRVYSTVSDNGQSSTFAVTQCDEGGRVYVQAKENELSLFGSGTARSVFAGTMLSS